MSHSLRYCRTNEYISKSVWGCTCGVDDQTQCGGDFGGGDSGCFWIWTNKNKRGIYAIKFPIREFYINSILTSSNILKQTKKSYGFIRRAIGEFRFSFGSQ